MNQNFNQDFTKDQNLK